MGNSCGGVASACCSNDHNVDLNNQIEGVNGSKNGSKVSISGSFMQQNKNGTNKPIDIAQILKLPPDNK